MTSGSPKSKVAHAVLFFCLIEICTGSSLSAGSGIAVDVAKGEIDGRVAVSFWVAKEVGSHGLIDPSEFEVRLVPSTNLDKELAFPAGEWFQPPIGKYKVWLQGAGRMTPYSTVMVYGGGPFRGKGMASALPVVPAGTVALDPGIQISETTTLRVLHLDSHLSMPYPQREMTRRAQGKEARSGILMPEGRVIGALFDNEIGEYLAVSRPVTVRSGSTSRVVPAPPQRSETDLLVRLERSEILTDHGADDLKLLIQSSDQDIREPDVVVPTVDRVYGVWYGLSGKFATLRVESPSEFLPPKEISLRSGSVETCYENLRPLPDVDARLGLPAALASSTEIKLTIVRQSTGETIREVTVPPDSRNMRLERIPAEPLALLLSVRPWRFRHLVDLSDGRDQTVYFEARPITLTGTVYRGDRAHPAVVEFETNNDHDTLSVTTDEEGVYKATLYRVGHYIVRVRLEGVEQPPYVELLDHAIKTDTTLDFWIPDNEYRVHVVDSNTGDGVPEAKVVVGNRFTSRGGNEAREAGRAKVVTLNIVTGEDGIGHLRPLHSGDLTLSAAAPGYLPSDPVEVVIEESEPSRELTIPLRPVTESAELRVLFSTTGLPAIGAEILLQSSLGDVRPSWKGETDAKGAARIPTNLGSVFVLIRHPDAGFLIRPLLAVEGSETWTLPAMAPPLSLHVTRPWGDTAGWARLALWIEGRCLSGRTLAWLTGTSAAVADREGHWQAPNLPPVSIKILAWTPGSSPELLSLEGLATDVDFPWESGVLELETLD